jgi:hypothetical protein
LVTITQAATALSLNRHTLRHAVQRGRLPAVRRPGGAPGGLVYMVDTDDVRALYSVPPVTTNGRPPAPFPGVEAAVRTLVAEVVNERVAHAVEALRAECVDALAVVRDVADRLAHVDVERQELQRRQAALADEEAHLREAVERHRAARVGYETKRRELTRYMVAAGRKG